MAHPDTAVPHHRLLGLQRLSGRSPLAVLATLSLWLMPMLLGLCLMAVTTAARAQSEALTDPPGRVGRLSHLQGPVFWFDPDEGQWMAANHNRPLTSGDRIATGVEGRAEVRVGSSLLLLGNATELEVLRLDDERMAWQVHSGSLALRVRNREAALETEVVVADVRLLPERAGLFRLDHSGATAQVGAWRGSLRVPDPLLAGGALLIETGQRLELWRESGRDSPRWSGQAAALRQRDSRWPDDEFAAWVLAEDRQADNGNTYRYVSPEMTGAEDLDRHGRWEQHPDHGAMWIPTVIAADWAPYRHGRWAWVQPWGWTWVDDARWGFAPFHYGRWVNWRGRWGWCPGVYQARPVYAPALVAWVGGPRLSVSVSIGLPSVAWVPLAPRELFVPHYRHTPVYRGRVNAQPPWPGQPPRRGPDRPAPYPTGTVTYSNQGVPGGVTVVPRDVLLQRQPVARAVVDLRLPATGPQLPGARAPEAGWQTVAPPAIERPQRPNPGREERANDRRGAPERRDDRADDRRDDRGRRDPRDRRDEREPIAGADTTRPNQGQPVVPVQPPAPAPANLPVPRMQAPAAEPALPRMEPGSREPRDADRRRGDMPAWTDRPQRPTVPAAPAAAGPPAPAAAGPPSPAAAGPPSPSPAAAPAAVAPKPQPPVQAPPVPAARPVPAPAAAAPAPAQRPERPREPAASESPKASDKAPKEQRTADPEEGRKRGPGGRDRERDNLR